MRLRHSDVQKLHLCCANPRCFRIRLADAWANECRSRLTGCVGRERGSMPQQPSSAVSARGVRLMKPLLGSSVNLCSVSRSECLKNKAQRGNPTFSGVESFIHPKYPGTKSGLLKYFVNHSDIPSLSTELLSAKPRPLTFLFISPFNNCFQPRYSSIAEMNND